ncbi:MAG: histidine kinase dimerization/phosphoacceptor domain -containing protein [Bacteroidota bacterium]
MIRSWLWLTCLIPTCLWGQVDTAVLNQEIRAIADDSLRLEQIKGRIQHHYLGEPEIAVAYATWYAKEAHKSQDSFLIARSENFLGIAIYGTGDVNEAIRHYLLAYRGFESVGDSLQMGIVLNNVGAAYEVRGKREETLRYYEEAASIFEALNNQEWIAIVQNNLANQYFITDPKKALVSYQKAYEIHQTLGIKDRIGSFLMNMANCYNELGQFDRGIALVEEAIPLLEQINDQEGLVNANLALGKAYFDLEQLGKAENYLLNGWQIAFDHDLLARQSNLALALGELYKQKRSYREALKWRETHVSLQDSLFNREKDQQMTEMLAEFEAENKDKEIRLLTAENEVARLNLQQNRRRMLLLGIGTFLVLIIAGLIGMLWNNNRRQNQQLSEKNGQLAQALDDKETLMREIHHRVKNNLQVISSLLRLQGRRLEDPSAKIAIEASQARLEAISLIHHFLYQDEDVANVDVKAYLSELLRQLSSLHQGTIDQLEISSDLDNVSLDIDVVLPISLVVNELLTNAFKYADYAQGQVNIHLAFKREPEALLLQVRDNGPGYVPNERGSQSSLGLRLVQTFVKRLSGEITVQAEAGTNVMIRFPWTAIQTDAFPA